MGVYLNSKSPTLNYAKVCSSPYFVDKTELISKLIPMIDAENNYLCITRPRRFGKTVMANMLAAYLGKAADSSVIFNSLDISKTDIYEQYLNQFDIISIDFSEVPDVRYTYQSYIDRIIRRLKRDLKRTYPDMELDMEDTLWDLLTAILEETGHKFIFVFDEWDYIFQRDFISDEDKQAHLVFLSNLLKGKAYVSLAYMTGILPIAKYSSGSELNMFAEFTMASTVTFSEYFGFTEDEVDRLYHRYLKNCSVPAVSREGLKNWYDGYHTASGERVYNPRSVVFALQYNQLNSYWTSSGPYDEIFYYVKNNIADIRDDLALMISGESVEANIREYAASAMELQTRDEIISAMVVYGFLSAENGRVSIPNKELMDEFEVMLRKESSLGYVYRLAKASDRMLKATLAGDTDTMTEILQYAHNTETPILSYNHEIELSAIVNLVYLSARDRYRIEREDKAGKGYVDFIFYPVSPDSDCVILELKVDQSPEYALNQIREKQYALRFHGKLGEIPGYTGRVLAVGISYDRKTKQHSCKVAVLE